MVKVVDPRTPVIVGVGQVENRVDRGADEVEPGELIARAAEAAAADSGGRGVLAALETAQPFPSLPEFYELGETITRRVT